MLNVCDKWRSPALKIAIVCSHPSRPLLLITAPPSMIDSHCIISHVDGPLDTSVYPRSRGVLGILIVCFRNVTVWKLRLVKVQVTRNTLSQSSLAGHGT